METNIHMHIDIGVHCYNIYIWSKLKRNDYSAPSMYSFNLQKESPAKREDLMIDQARCVLRLVRVSEGKVSPLSFHLERKM